MRLAFGSRQSLTQKSIQVKVRNEKHLIGSVTLPWNKQNTNTTVKTKFHGTNDCIAPGFWCWNTEKHNKAPTYTWIFFVLHQEQAYSEDDTDARYTGLPTRLKLRYG